MVPLDVLHEPEMDDEEKIAILYHPDTIDDRQKNDVTKRGRMECTIGLLH